MDIYSKIKPYITLFIPRFFIELFRLFWRKKNLLGIYKNWEEACNQSSGYSNQIILQKVESSLQQVKQGKAIYERDSIVFYEKNLNIKLLAALGIAQLNGQNVSVLDFGGSLGSTYYQHKHLFKNIEWSIIEQEHFVKKGKELFEIDELKFFQSIDECMKNRSCNFLILSSVIQYIEKPIELIEKIMSYNFCWIFIDRTPFFENEKENPIISIQKVPESIYKASIPIHIFNLQEFKNYFNVNYELEFECDCEEKWLFGVKKIGFRGLFFKFIK